MDEAKMEKAERESYSGVWCGFRRRYYTYKELLNRLGTTGPRNQESVVFFFFETRKIKASLQ